MNTKALSLEQALENVSLHGAKYAKLNADFTTLANLLAPGRKTLDIGAGRYPKFSFDEARELGTDYWVNDLEDSELERSGYPTEKRVVFDVGGALPDSLGGFDLIFSSFVLEHLKCSLDYYRNIYDLLSDGGIGLTKHPTKYCLPFMINTMIPQKLTDKLMCWYSNKSRRTFPAFYDLCYATEKNRNIIEDIGFSQVIVLKYYGHPYFDRIPGLKQIDSCFFNLMNKINSDLFACYAITITIK